jgi:hypothetical protein
MKISSGRGSKHVEVDEDDADSLSGGEDNVDDDDEDEEEDDKEFANDNGEGDDEAATRRSHDKKWLCPVPLCGKSFGRRKYLNRHLNTNLFTHRTWRKEESQKDATLHQCSDCDKVYYQAHHLSRHRKLHHDGPWPYACPASGCEEKFSKQTLLRQHHTLFHQKKALLFCEQCGKKFVNQPSLTVHLDKAHDCLTCPEAGCGATFRGQKGRQQFYQHILIHQVPAVKTAKKRGQRDRVSIAARKRYHCDYPGCTKAFTERRNLAQHLKTGHSEARPYVCLVFGCHKAFKYKCVLERHLEICHEEPATKQPNKKPRQRQERGGGRGGGRRGSCSMNQVNGGFSNTPRATLETLQRLDRSSKKYREILLDTIIGNI